MVGGRFCRYGSAGMLGALRCVPYLEPLEQQDLLQVHLVRVGVKGLGLG